MTCFVATLPIAVTPLQAIANLLCSLVATACFIAAPSLHRSQAGHYTSRMIVRSFHFSRHYIFVGPHLRSLVKK